MLVPEALCSQPGRADNSPSPASQASLAGLCALLCTGREGDSLQCHQLSGTEVPGPAEATEKWSYRQQLPYLPLSSQGP